MDILNMIQNNSYHKIWWKYSIHETPDENIRWKQQMIIADDNNTW
jgi:hypothetical protein